MIYISPYLNFTILHSIVLILTAYFLVNAFSHISHPNANVGYDIVGSCTFDTVLYNSTNFQGEQLISIRVEHKKHVISREANTVELQWLEHLWDHENKFQTGVV